MTCHLTSELDHHHHPLPDFRGSTYLGSVFIEMSPEFTFDGSFVPINVKEPPPIIYGRESRNETFLLPENRRIRVFVNLNCLELR